MRGTLHTRKRLWRWRSNPLRRPDDITEAWLVLAVWLLIAVAGTVVGMMTAHAADEMFARQREQRHPVRAVLLDDVPKSAGVGGTGSDRRSAGVRWSAPDGSERTGRTLVDAGHRAGATVVVWQDAQGRLKTEPPNALEAAVESATLGAGAACGLAGALYGAGRIARWRLDRRRLEGWGREWDVVGPLWGHRTG
ncbi:hypothetical protein [Streptomyces acidiscabies]|uniref:Uncharacterized protein n=1 Tax=Streptomyces acidiscabies TaxID=42234 RepID=A0AAP6BBL4_9ACTN|nr:hypothetical protein [Streptomyces acidiscabies]MBP5942454.1 hypothetical protein [Streptomyces sp. LBUM 1476]MBZ3917799.1 hypothetical protein [Streptomyces acidiscabies]MDX2961769.1 hypothetical protein [Streptomyces acidiscabies]MDX3023484.1 hypothetical protein [Streptomyces acidiscabies]MDX3789310.1 hypothetical protein [Streptomyces acidiscabies]